MSIELVTGFAGKPHVTASDHAWFNAGMFTKKDYMLPTRDLLAAQVLTANSMHIGAGDILMQAKHVSCPEPTSITITSGTVGFSRIDLVVIHYEKDPTTGIETVEWQIKKGEPSQGEPVEPSIIEGDLFAEALVNELAVYRILITDLVPGEPELLLDTYYSLDDIIDLVIDRLMFADKPLEVSNGGTGAADTATARKNLEITPANIGAAASSHNHDAGNITSGTLPVARGGTGITANPSLLINLAATTAAGVFQSAPRPGVTGTLPVARGGTGITNLADNVIAQGSSGIWRYIKFQSKKFIAWHCPNTSNLSCTATSAAQSVRIALPFSVTANTDCTVLASGNSREVWIRSTWVDATNTRVEVKFSLANTSATTVGFNLIVCGIYT